MKTGVAICLYVIKGLLMSAFGVMLTGMMAATGLAYYWGDLYLTRFVTSWGPGPLFSVLMPLGSLVGLFGVWAATFLDVFDRFVPVGSKQWRIAIMLSFLYLILCHISATVILVHLRSPYLFKKPWVVALTMWLHDDSGNLLFRWVFRPLLNIGADQLGQSYWWLSLVSFIGVVSLLHKIANADYLSSTR